MSIEGKKLKQHIGKLKEALDDISFNEINSLSTCLRLLIISEISQRGIIAPLDCDDEKLLQIIINTAGKMLLNGNQVKAPLIAGAAVVSAIIAQKIAEYLLTLPEQYELLENFGSAFQRARDVDDARLLIILNLVTRTSTKETFGNDSIDQFEAIAFLLMRIALGNNFRAACFSNPEQPPIFKRSLDSCLKANITLRRLVLKSKNDEDDNININSGSFENDDDYLSYYTRDAIYPLSNLIRIAESKQNSKRMSELCLRIAQSCIGGEVSYYPSCILSSSGCQLYDDIDKSYIGDLAKEEFGAGNDVASNLELVKRAKKSLSIVDASSFDNDEKLSILYKHIKLRVELSHEESLASIIGNERYVASRNRIGLSSGAGSKESFEEEVKRELVTGTLPSDIAEEIGLDYDRLSTDAASELLRDGFLALSGSVDSKVGADLLNALCFNTGKQIERLVQRSQTTSIMMYKKKNRNAVATAWDAVLDFVGPLVCSLGDNDQNTLKFMKPSKRELFRSASEALITYLWMASENSQASTESTRFATKFLTDFLEFQKDSDKKAARKLAESEGKVISTTGVTLSKSKLGVEVGCRAARCHQLLATIGSGKNISDREEHLIQVLSEEAKNIVRQKNRSKYEPELNAKFGTPFVLLMCCWSGLHSSPWSFCNISQARSIVRYVRESIRLTTQVWGRKPPSTEAILVDIAEADSECGFLPGGMSMVAKKLFVTSLERLTNDDCNPVQMLLRSHCTSGLARLELAGTIDDCLCVQSADILKSSMQELKQILGRLPARPYFCLWRNSTSLQSSIEYHILLKMQLVAEILLKAQRPDDAKGFLEDAAKDSPQNYGIAFSYGSFLLQMALYNTAFGSRDMLQKAQRQLLKAAKMNVKKADPFALLGIWYEVQNDTKRAIGCYSKALLSDPSHPVAGRGMLRSNSSKNTSMLCDNALNDGIFQNGWAWKCLGDSKAFLEGDDERAVLCYQQALRARDVASPMQHRLSVFFSLPCDEENSIFKECGGVWASLGLCYRRLGKHSASVRAFQSASNIFPSDLSYFCSWAHVELELGLLDESAAKFRKVLDSDGDIQTCHSAQYGLANCMLVFARQAIEQGKFGDALSCLEEGIRSLLIFVENQDTVSCVWKLLGDLYSHSMMIPISVFGGKDYNRENGNKLKAEFIAQGEEAYMRVLSSMKTYDSQRMGGASTLRTVAFNDIAINLYLRARLQSEYLSEGSGIGPSTSRTQTMNNGECRRLLDRSITYFISAIEVDPFSSISWCGLGITLMSRDPILAQHAFCRALQLDKGTEDAWANLSLLYFDHDNLHSSEEAVDSLTQVADSAIMWITRGLLIEKQKQSKESGDSESALSEASDAYRASLQISRHDAALLGLAVTSRRLGVNEKMVSEDYIKEVSNLLMKESHTNLEMFMNSNARSNLGALALNGIMTCERSLKSLGQRNVSSQQMQGFLQNGKDILEQSKEKIVQLPERVAPNTSDSVECVSIDNRTMGVGNFLPITDMEEVISSSLKVADDTIHSILSKDCSVSQRTSTSITMARQNVIHNPDNGLMWLDLSKALLRAMPLDMNDNLLTTVRSTVQKARHIMVSSAIDVPLLHPIPKQNSTFHKSVPATPVAATSLSEVFALSDWIEDFGIESRHYGSYDLHRALLLDPENTFARSKMND